MENVWKNCEIIYFLFIFKSERNFFFRFIYSYICIAEDVCVVPWNFLELRFFNWFYMEDGHLGSGKVYPSKIK